jgi:deoxyribodipyrimidine photo-lyase
VNRALFLFRRDLRLEDNKGLLFAAKNAKEIILGFIFTPEQIDRNPYRSNHCLQFMIESLEDLERQIEAKNGKLYLFFGKPEKIVADCIKSLHVDAVIVNRDYTPYSDQRDLHIKSTCKKHAVEFYSFEDALLHPLDEVLKSDGKPYTVFTPFFRNAVKLNVDLPVKNHYQRYYSGSIPFAQDRSLYKKILPKRMDQQQGGRTAALKILKEIKQFSKYPSMRDIPAENATTHFYYEISKKLGAHSELIRSLYWRDFFSSIAFYFPQVFKYSFREKFNKIKWSRDKKKFKLWCEGKTGFPIVDAGMREMNQTGFMHNRVRMIVGSFLVKDLHIDWRWGEKYFAQTLIDYDPSINNGNWQWVASTGCDAQPYFRIFNPWAQGLKFDPECLYIKRWVPELNSLDPKVIHSWHFEKYHRQSKSYPAPIVDHDKESKISLANYKKCAHL